MKDDIDRIHSDLLTKTILDTPTAGNVQLKQESYQQQYHTSTEEAYFDF